MFQGQTVLVTDAKGYHDLAQLLAQPDKEIHCAELMGSTLQHSEETTTLDSKAKLAYQKKMQELQSEIEEAEEMNDPARATALQEEYEKIIDHLSQSLGLAGKPRKIGSSVEKARTAVTWRIRNAIKKLDKAHPALAKHLSASIQTGTFCSYKPELSISWVL